MNSSTFLERLARKQQVAPECEATIQNMLSRCYSLDHARQSLKLFLEQLDAQSNYIYSSVQKQGLLRAIVPFKIMLARKRDAELYNRCANKLNRSLNGFCIGNNWGKTVLVHDIVFSGVELAKYNPKNGYQVVVTDKLYIIAKKDDHDRHVYFANRKWLDFPVKGLIIYGIDEEGLLTNCPYNEDTLKMMVSFKEN